MNSKNGCNGFQTRDASRAGAQPYRVTRAGTRASRATPDRAGARPYQSQAKARCAAIGALRGLHAADEEFAFEDEFLREMSVQVEEKLLLINDFLAPGVAVHLLEFLELLLRKIQSVPVDVFVAWLPAEGGFFAEGTPASAVHDPL